MYAPRFARGRSVVVAAVLLGLAGPPLAWAGQNAPRPSGKVSYAPPLSRVEQSAPQLQGHQTHATSASNDSSRSSDAPRTEGEIRPLTAEQVQVLLAVVLLRSPYGRPNTTPPQETPPPDNPTPPIIPPPPETPPANPPPEEPPPTIEHSPEPATLATALVGASLGVCAWWRRRKARGQVADADEENAR
jgi:hypothetical protein